MRDQPVVAGNLAKGALAGAVAGLAGGFVMDLAMRATRGPQAASASPPPLDPKVALLEKAGFHVAPEREETVEGLVHDAMSAFCGAAYGASAEISPRVTALWGIPFGLAVWAAAPLVALPALGLSPPHTQIPAQAHAKNMMMHALFGATTEAVRRPLRAAMG